MEEKTLLANVLISLTMKPGETERQAVVRLRDVLIDSLSLCPTDAETSFEIVEHEVEKEAS